VGHIDAGILPDAVGEPRDEQHGRDQRHPGELSQAAPVCHQPWSRVCPPGTTATVAVAGRARAAGRL
jgi:hypothetical protein